MDDQPIEERVTQLEQALETVTENQAVIKDFVAKRLFMIDELTNDIRRVLGIGTG